jgi:GT2 family glycosyltransferase
MQSDIQQVDFPDPASRQASDRTSPDVSVVVVTYESSACIARCIDALSAHLNPREILVVDNNSNDGTVEALANAPSVEVIVNGSNAGFGRACNVGAARSRSEAILFLNPDALIHRVDKARFRTLVDSAHGVHGFASSGPAAFKENAITMDVLDQAFTPLKPREITLPRWPRRRPDWVSGSALLVNGSEFRDVGGFDERFFLYYEDRELCARYRRAGAPIKVSRSIELAHEFGTSSGDASRVFPYACQILSWIEYTALRAGLGRAQQEMTRVRSFHRRMAKGLSTPPLRSLLRTRAEQKATQLVSLWEAVEYAADTLRPSGYYPIASELILQ